MRIDENKTKHIWAKTGGRATAGVIAVAAKRATSVAENAESAISRQWK